MVRENFARDDSPTDISVELLLLKVSFKKKKSCLFSSRFSLFHCFFSSSFFFFFLLSFVNEVELSASTFSAQKAKRAVFPTMLMHAGTDRISINLVPDEWVLNQSISNVPLIG